ncbi:MAG: hydantoinase B/oxoprolinase family protein [Actinobacteria bacterium]|nr:hydantoinase B/oxoprolinase family protein [Actinomycetota bacterium]
MTASGSLDPITFEVLHAALLSTAQEMGAVLKRSSYSPIIREMEDFSCALFDAEGRLVVQADYIPAQLGAMSLVVQSTLEQWGDAVEPGDVFIANHPYMGGMHTMDLNVFAPLFVDGGLFAWAGTTAHHIDVGGVNPGSEGPSHRQVYAEGLLLPPSRLYRKDEENPDLFGLIEANVRDPFATLGDLRAQHAACVLGKRRVDEVVERYGPATVRAAFSQALDRVEKAARVALAALPDGEGEAEGYMDDDAVGGPPTRIHARLVKEGDHLLVDLSGSAPQVPGALNVPWASTRATVMFLVRAIADPDLTTNDGILRPLEIVCPRGTILNPHPPAAVSVRHNTCQRLADTLLHAASSIWPEKAVGSSTVTFVGMSIEGTSPKTGRTAIMTDVVGGGTGGHRWDDGLDGVDTYLANVALLPVEVAETEYSIRILRSELIPGSQGLGEQNGGLGLRRDYQVLGTTHTAIVYCEQTDPRFRPRGVAGGGAGAPTRLTIFGPDGDVIPTPSKVTMVLEPWSVVRVETSGGGGYGDPAARDPAAARADLEDGLLGGGERLSGAAEP